MHLENLRLMNFRLYEKYETVFSSGINVITGENGIGKTSILEAVHYLSLTKSFRSQRDTESVNFSADSFFVLGKFKSETKNKEEVSVAYSKETGKIFKVEGNKLKTAAEMVGRYPLVFLAPEDVILTLGPPEGHRNFLNMTISQVDKERLSDLLSYRTLIKQRNATIESVVSGKNQSSKDMLDVLEIQISAIAARIVDCRAEFIDFIKTEFENTFKLLNYGKKTASIEYSPSVHGTEEEIYEKLKENRATDFNLGYSTRGPHRDKLKFKMNGKPLKNFGSKGENKIFLVALKIAQGKYIEEKTGHKPIYLLDDIFTELDRKRATKTIEMITEKGQVILTTTDFGEWSDAVTGNVNVIGIA